MRFVRWAIVVLFVAGMVALSVQPVRYHFLTDKKVAEIPDHTSYRKAMEELLPGRVRAMAEGKECGDFLIPPKGVTGMPEGLPHLLVDVRMALGSHMGWQLCVDDAVKEAMINRWDERFKLWGNMGTGREMIAHIRSQKDAAMKVRYSALCSVQALTGSGHDRRVVVTVNDEKLQSKLFDVSVSFMAPDTFKNLTARRDAALATLAAEKARAKKQLTMAGGLGAALFVYLLGWGAWAYGARKKRGAYHAYLIGEIEKREDLVRNGHYVAALELADEYLATFPKDTEIKAFKERLLDFTGGDPKKAQLAWVEAKKLAQRLAAAAPLENGRFLLADEKRDIAGLVPYHPELKTSFDRLLAMDEAAERERTAAADGRFAEVEGAFRRGDLPKGRSLLEGFLRFYPDYPAAVAMKGALSNPSGRSFTLKTGDGAHVTVVASDRLTLGRGDDGDAPDVVFADRRISRRHLCLILDTGVLTASDLGSAGGTYVNGDAIDGAVSLGVGDLLTLSRVINFDVTCIQKSGSGATGALLQGDEGNLCLVRSKLELEFSGSRLGCAEGRVSIWRVDGTVWVVTPKSLVFPGEKSVYRVEDTLEVKEVTE
ncbi:FHA domain-containing protein [Desulfoluna spongiiphila]|uniref:FHA domain-containing protein n=1 Tax=Desulfoluna spongiiphila TaxID=419481 RepID=UPI00125A21D6|nr:FHA domain-containing protein [Desulfoluna spongiiphila]VVS90613.1 forkhead-associated (fha) domain [Desulfoluna spongiiphila]